jgi:hypothetical protein
MARLEPRIERLEARIIKPDKREVILLSSLDPDFDERSAEALERGAVVIALVPLEGKNDAS